MPIAPAPLDATGRRWSASAWLFARPGGGTAALGQPELGGSQAGLRLTYRLAGSVSAVARAASPLAGPGREAALGLDWRAGGLPLHLTVEERIGLDRTIRSAPAVGAVAGIGPRPLALGVSLESYGEAGLIAARRGGYADGALRLTRPVARIGPAGLALGLGAWGGAQRGAARLDLGPSAGLDLPIAGHVARLTIDWRERVAGNARPASGPAVTLGGDF